MTRWIILTIKLLITNAVFGYIAYIILQDLNEQYYELNQPCPYDNDFDCYYRYLLCEDDCNSKKPLPQTRTNLITESRKDEFLLGTTLANMMFKLVTLSVFYALILTLGIIRNETRTCAIAVGVTLYHLRTYKDGNVQGDYTKILGNWLIIFVIGIACFISVLILLARVNFKGKIYAWSVYGSMLFLLLSLVVGTGHRFFNSCSQWDKGLYGESIDNTVNCEFKKPGFCLYEFFGDMYDYNYWLMLSCEDRKPHWGKTSQMYPNATRVGFPIMPNATREQRLTANVPSYVLTHVKIVNDANEKDFEVILHRTYDSTTSTYREPAWIEINIQFNEELVKQRSAITSQPLSDNVLVIYVNSLSRPGAFRQLPKTMKLFEQMSPKVHQFFKYHSITPNTAGNMYPLFYGITWPYKPDPPKQLKTPSFVHEYKNNGFITGRALSTCAVSALDDPLNSHVVDEEPFDNMGNGWACDINAQARVPGDATNGPMSLLRKCAYGKEMSEYTLEYGRKFWDTYKDQKKLLWLDFFDLKGYAFTHGQYLDEHLSIFLSSMDLSETMLMLVGDHGQQPFNNQIFTHFISQDIEKGAPALFVKLPASLEGTYGKGLEANKQQLIQAFDINRLLKVIPNSSAVNETMLNPIPAKKNSCDFPIKDQGCQCKLIATAE